MEGQSLTIENRQVSSTEGKYELQGVPKKGINKNFNSDLFMALIRSVLISLSPVDL